MTARLRLPHRRETVLFEFRGAPYTLGVGRFEDGALADVSFDCSAESNAQLSDDAKDAAACLSIALKYGAPAHVIRDAVTRASDGSANTIIGHVLDLLESSE